MRLYPAPPKLGLRPNRPGPWLQTTHVLVHCAPSVCRAKRCPHVMTDDGLDNVGLDHLTNSGPAPFQWRPDTRRGRSP